MTYEEFFGAIESSVSPGREYRNPGGGTSRIESSDRQTVTYLRGGSAIAVKVDELYRAYERFKGERVSSTDLRRFNPRVFDSAARSAGHSCNCTFLYSVLQDANLAGPLQGAGVRGDPYAVVIPNDA